MPKLLWKQTESTKKAYTKSVAISLLFAAYTMQTIHISPWNNPFPVPNEFIKSAVDKPSLSIIIDNNKLLYGFVRTVDSIKGILL